MGDGRVDLTSEGTLSLPSRIGGPAPGCCHAAPRTRRVKGDECVLERGALYFFYSLRFSATLRQRVLSCDSKYIVLFFLIVVFVPVFFYMAPVGHLGPP